MTAMGRVSASVEVPLGLVATWDAAVDWPSQERWVPASTVRATGGSGFGGTIEARTGWGPLTIVDPMEITTWDPPYRVVLAHTGRFVQGMAIYQIEPLGPDRSRFTWTEALDAPVAALKPIYLVGTPMFGGLMRVALRRFARWAPTLSAAGGPEPGPESGTLEGG